MARTEDLAKLVVQLEAESAQLRKDMEKANKHVEGFRRNADKQVALFKKSMVALSAAVPIAAFVGLTKHSIDFADRITDVAEKTAFSYKAIQELGFAASQTGVDIGVLEGGLGRFTKRLGLARAGTGAAAATYKQLGVDLTQTNEQVFKQVVETLGSMENQTNALALTTRLFGDDAQSMFNLFRDGNAGLQSFADKAHELGLVLSDELIEGASEANDQLSIMKQVVNAQMVKVFAELAPVITQVGQAFADAAPGIAAFFGSFGEVDNMTKGAAEEVARRAQEQYDGLYKLLEKRIALDKGEVPLSAGSLFDQVMIGSEEELRAKLAEQEKIFKGAIERIKSLGRESVGSGAQNPIEPLDVSKLFGLGGGSGDDDIDDWLKDIEAGFKEAADMRKKYNDDVQKIIAEVDPSIPLDKEINHLQTLIELYPQYEDVLTEALFNKYDELDKLNKGLEEQEDQFKELKQAVEGWGQSFADALVDGEGNFEDFASGILKQMQRIAIQQVTDPLFSAFGEFLQSLNPFSTPSVAGKRAAGGPVSAGSIYEVNEKGDPELLTYGGRQYLMMGTRSGYVTPPRPSGVSRETAPIININTYINVDSNGVDRGSGNGSQLNEFGRMVDQAVMSVIGRELRPGGVLS